MNKKLVVSLAILAIAAAGAAGIFLVQQNRNNTISKGAVKVIETIFDIPNPDLYDADSVTFLGEGIPPLTEQQKAKIQAASDRVQKNWESRVGKYFAENCFQGFLSGSGAGRYHMMAGLEDTTITLKDMKLSQKDFYEKIVVTIEIDGQEQQLEFVFQHNEKGQITQVYYTEMKA